jgi:hypothetical protein
MCAGGCADDNAWPDGPLPEVNAVLDSNAPLRGTVHSSASTNVVLTARCTASDEFANTKIRERQGPSPQNWSYTWYVVRCAVVKVEQGTWDKPEVSFLYCQATPIPGSGIMLDVAPLPYRRGIFLRFWLDATVTPACLLGQEEVSPPPPLTQPAAPAPGK